MSNKSRSIGFRRGVAALLERSGLDVQARVAEPRGLTDDEKVAADRGDILGTPWVLSTSNATRFDLNKALDDARDGARRAGTDLFATIQRRRDRSLGDSYVVMTLDVFTSVLRQSAGSTATTAPGR